MVRTLLRFVYLTLCCFLLASGCSGGCWRQDVPPENQLHTYITRAVNASVPDDRDGIIELTADPLRAALANLSPTDFKKAYLDTKFEVQTFEILQRQDLSEKEIHMDFRIVYRSWTAGEVPDRVPTVDTRNRAILKYEFGRWALANVESLESNFHWEIGLSLDDVEATDGPPVEVVSSRDPRFSGDTPPEAAVDEQEFSGSETPEEETP